MHMVNQEANLPLNEHGRINPQHPPVAAQEALYGHFFCSGG